MSLIQEALKRQQEESQDRQDAQGADVQGMAPSPPPPPPPGPGPRPPAEYAPRPPSKGKRSVWLAVLGVFAALLLLIGGAGALIYFSASSLFNSMEGKDAGTTNIESMAITIDLQPVEPTITNAVAGVGELGLDTGIPVEIVTPPSTNSTVEPAPAVPTETLPLTSSSPESAAAQTSSVVWPELVLEGIVGKGNAGSARLNGKVVYVGDVVEGVRVVGIHANPNSAELEFEGDRKIVPVGNATR